LHARDILKFDENSLRRSNI